MGCAGRVANRGEHGVLLVRDSRWACAGRRPDLPAR
jgi:hypothetical protein